MIKVILVLVIVILLQHLVHELGHIGMAKLMGIKIVKIHWFTYSKFLGTRVFYEFEPDFNDSKIEKKWGFVSLAGAIVTTVIGYLTMVLYVIQVRSFILFMITVIFVLMDSFYFTVGSFLGFGDVCGVGKVFNIPRWVLISGSMCLFLINLWLVNQYVWN